MEILCNTFTMQVKFFPHKGLQSRVIFHSYCHVVIGKNCTWTYLTLYSCAKLIYTIYISSGQYIVSIDSALFSDQFGKKRSYKLIQ